MRPLYVTDVVETGQTCSAEILPTLLLVFSVMRNY